MSSLAASLARAPPAVAAPARPRPAARAASASAARRVGGLGAKMPPARLARRASSARRAIVDADAGEGEAIVLDDVSEAISAAAEEAEDDPAVPSSMKVPKSAVVRDLAKEVESRRTFAIISHPDAGKTTLTEKLLYYGGAINEAGAVILKHFCKIQCKII